MAKPSVSGKLASIAILSVNTDGEAFIEEFAESIAKLTYANYHLIVVDNDSSDRSLEILHRLQPEATILRNETNLGFTGACNRGLLYCLDQRFDYILFLNNDLVMEPDCLDQLLAAADGHTMTVPKSYLYHHPGRLDDSVGEFDWLRGVWKQRILGTVPSAQFDKPRLVESANLSCLLMPSDLLRTVGLLDENFFIYYDDTDYARRAREAGFHLRFVPSAVVHHRKGATIGGSETPFGIYYLTRNRPYLIRKHVRSRVRRASFWIYYLSTRLAYFAWLLGRRRPDLAKALVLGIFDYWRGRMGKTVERDHWPSGIENDDPGHRLTKGQHAKS